MRFQTYEKKKHPPPSQFSKLVYKFLDFEENRKSSHEDFDIVGFHSEQITAMVGRKGFKKVWMHRTKFLKHVSNDEGLDDEAGREKWDREIVAANDEDKDQGGPEKEPLRLHYLVEDYTVGETEVRLQKRLDMHAKDTKIKGTAQIEEMIDALGRNHVALDNSAFTAVGLGCRASASLGRRRLDGLNLEAGSEALPKLTDVAKTSATCPSKKHTVYRVDVERLKFRDFAENKNVAVESSISAVWERVLHARDMLLAVQQGGLEIQGLHEYQDVMVRRISYFKLLALSVGVSADYGASLYGVVLPDLSFNELIESLATVNTKVDAAAKQMENF